MILPRAQRLSSRERLDQVKTKGRGITGQALVLKWLKRSDQSSQEPSKIAFIVSLKVDKRAAVRHQLKRRLAESVRRLWLNLKFGYDLVIIVKAKAKQLNYQDLALDLEIGLTKAGLLRKAKRG